jgi:hypothetical protein
VAVQGWVGSEAAALEVPVVLCFGRAAVAVAAVVVVVEEKEEKAAYWPSMASPAHYCEQIPKRQQRCWYQIASVSVEKQSVLNECIVLIG